MSQLKLYSTNNCYIKSTFPSRDPLCTKQYDGDANAHDSSIISKSDSNANENSLSMRNDNLKKISPDDSIKLSLLRKTSSAILDPTYIQDHPKLTNSRTSLKSDSNANEISFSLINNSFTKDSLNSSKIMFHRGSTDTIILINNRNKLKSNTNAKKHLHSSIRNSPKKKHPNNSATFFHRRTRPKRLDSGRKQYSNANSSEHRNLNNNTIF